MYPSQLNDKRMTQKHEQSNGNFCFKVINKNV